MSLATVDLQRLTTPLPSLNTTSDLADLIDPRDADFDRMATQPPAFAGDDLPPTVLGDIASLVRGDAIVEHQVRWEDGSWDKAPAWTYGRRDVHAIDLSVMDLARGRLLRHRKGVVLGVGTWLHAIEAPADRTIDNLDILLGEIETDRLGAALSVQIDLLATRYDDVNGLPRLTSYSVAAQARPSSGGQARIFRSQDGEFGPYGVEVILRLPCR